MNSRLGFPLVMLAAGFAAVTWAVLNAQLPPADFTFVNGTEIKTVDPHNVTGIPEHRIVESLFEGLTRLNAHTCQPMPGVAESWEISDDKTVYTFHIRSEARWSNGEPMTAHDFVYSYRRFLDPQSAAEYAHLAWYIANAQRYTAGASGIAPGDLVEVELHQRPAGSLPFARGELIYGKLVRIDGDGPQRVFVVDVAGRERKIRSSDRARPGDKGIEACNQVLLDFREVGIRAIDDRTLEMRLEHPTPYWLSIIAYHAVLPVNRTCLETYGLPQWTFPENIVTNGAYRIEFRRIRDRIRLVKNDQYWDRDNVRLEVVDALAVTSQVTMFNLFETGKADWVDDPPAIVLRELLKPGRERKYLNPKPYLGTYYYLCNTKRKPLDDVRVRRALALALDREEITRTAVAAGEVPAYSLVPPDMPDYEGSTFGEENIAEARRLLAEAGYPDGRGFPRIDILYNTLESHQTIAQLARKQWQRNLGINVSTRNEEWASFQSQIRQQEYNLSRRGWIGDYIDPSTYLDIMVTDCENNNTGWSNAQYDRLIVAARDEPDEAKRVELFQRAERILMDELPIIPLYFYVSKSMVQPYVRGFYGNLLDNHPLRSIWIDRDSTEQNEFMRY